MNNNDLPPLLRDAGELSNLGIHLRNEITHSETGKGTLPRRWERNEMLYNIDPDATNLNLVDGMQSYPIPLWKPKADRIIGTVFKSVTGIEPYAQANPESGKAVDIEKAGRLARATTKLAKARQDRLGFDRAFAQCLRIAVNTGISQMYVHVHPGDQLGENSPFQKGEVLHEAIHPKDFMIFPHEAGTIRKAKSVGHRYYRTRDEIDRLFEAGAILTNEVGGSDTVGERGGKSSEFGSTVDTPVTQPHDHLIECWQIVTRRDFGEGFKDYIVNIAFKTQKVLSVAPLGYTKGRMYFDVRFDDEYGSYWPAGSPGQDIQGIQLIFSDLFNVAIQGGYAQAFPGVALIGATLNSKVKRWGPGTVWELPSGADVKVIGSAFNGEWIPKFIPFIQDVADAVSRISTLGTGENMPAGTTATAAAGFLQGQAEGKDQYSDFMAPTIADIFTFEHELLHDHFDDIKAAMGSDLGLDSYDDVNLPVTWKATCSAQTSLSVLLQKLQMCLTLAMNPQTTLDYQLVERQIMEALDLPFAPSGIEKAPGPTAQELMEIIMGLLSGTVQPEEAMAILQEAAGSSAASSSPPPPPGSPPPQPPVKITDIVDSKMFAMMTPTEQGEFLQQIGIQPDPARKQMNPHGNTANPNGPGPQTGPQTNGADAGSQQPPTPPSGELPPGGAPPTP